MGQILYVPNEIYEKAKTIWPKSDIRVDESLLPDTWLLSSDNVKPYTGHVKVKITARK